MYENVINLTQHLPTPDQLVEAQFIELSKADQDKIKTWLNFLPEEVKMSMISARAMLLADLAQKAGAKYAMVGGAPYLMAPLEQELHHRGIHPIYAISERVSVEENLSTGEVIKRNVFKHCGFYDAYELLD